MIDLLKWVEMWVKTCSRGQRWGSTDPLMFWLGLQGERGWQKKRFQDCSSLLLTLWHPFDLLKIVTLLLPYDFLRIHLHVSFSFLFSPCYHHCCWGSFFFPVYLSSFCPLDYHHCCNLVSFLAFCPFPFRHVFSLVCYLRCHYHCALMFFLFQFWTWKNLYPCCFFLFVLSVDSQIFYHCGHHQIPNHSFNQGVKEK